MFDLFALTSMVNSQCHVGSVMILTALFWGTGHGSLVSSMSTSYANGSEIDHCVQHIFSQKFFHLSLIQEEQVVSYFMINGH